MPGASEKFYVQNPVDGEEIIGLSMAFPVCRQFAECIEWMREKEAKKEHIDFVVKHWFIAMTAMEKDGVFND